MKALSGVDAIYNLEILDYETLPDFRTAAEFLERAQNVAN
jgi:hypothetical protein